MVVTSLTVRPVSMPHISRQVAVIGAGAAGLAAARELRREGHAVVVIERAKEIGGTSVYTPEVESDLLGVDPRRSVVHSSLYDSLRTNLPREVMGFRDYPFLSRDSPGRDPRRFPGHREVLLYLKDFAADFLIEELVRFETEVLGIELAGDGRWRVLSRKAGVAEAGDDELYDAVVVCNGHYTEPRIAEIPGINSWPGKQMHSHNYRIPEPFRDQVVVIIGSSSSAVDISRDVARVAKEVHVASRSVEGGNSGKQPGYNNMWIHSMIANACEDGAVAFEDGSAIYADIILHCTGYKYHFPFLKTGGIVTVDDNCVGPLYKHVLPPALAPWLSFVGLPWKVVPFPMFELQCKWIAGLLSGRILLPPQAEMMKDVEAFYSMLEATGTPKRYTHNLATSQFDYNNWLAAQCGCPLSEEWRKQMYSEVSKNRHARPETYRDEWEDDHLVLQANEDFTKYTSAGTKW